MPSSSAFSAQASKSLGLSRASPKSEILSSQLRVTRMFPARRAADRDRDRGWGMFGFTYHTTILRAVRLGNVKCTLHSATNNNAQRPAACVSLHPLVIVFLYCSTNSLPYRTRRRAPLKENVPCSLFCTKKRTGALRTQTLARRLACPLPADMAL